MACFTLKGQNSHSNYKVQALFININYNSMLYILLYIVKLTTWRQFYASPPGEVLAGLCGRRGLCLERLNFPSTAQRRRRLSYTGSQFILSATKAAIYAVMMINAMLGYAPVISSIRNAPVRGARTDAPNSPAMHRMSMMTLLSGVTTSTSSKADVTQAPAIAPISKTGISRPPATPVAKLVRRKAFLWSTAAKAPSAAGSCRQAAGP